MVLVGATAGCGCGSGAAGQGSRVPEGSRAADAASEGDAAPAVEEDAPATPTPTAEEDDADRAAVAATGFSEADLARAVSIEPSPSPSPLSPDPAPFTVRQEVIDQARLQSDRPLSAEALHRLIRGNQFTFRALACDRAADSGDPRLVPVLIDALADESMHVGARYLADSGLWTTRERCYRALRRLTDESFGFRWDDPPDQRREAIDRWRSWYLESRAR